MTFDPAKPRYTLPFAGKDYELEGTFGLIEAIETAMQDGIVSVMVRAVEMPVSETAKLIAAALSFSGHKMTAKEVGTAIFDRIGASGEEFAVLRLHLFAMLKIFTAPPTNRQEAGKEMGELLGKWATASRGEITSDSV